MSDDLTCTNCGEYVGSPIADRIEALDAENARLKIALNYFFLRDIGKPMNWEYERNLAEELARAALQDEDGE